MFKVFVFQRKPPQYDVSEEISSTLWYRIIGGVGIILTWVENQRFNRPKTKNYITEGKIIFGKLISGGDAYSALESSSSVQ